MPEEKENRISIEDLPQAEQELTHEEAKDVKGGLIGLLLPAVQKVNAAAETTKSNSPIIGGQVIGKGIAGDGS